VVEEVIQALESLMKNPQIFLEHISLGVAEQVIKLLNHSRRIDKSFLDSLGVGDVA
jgi:hypothetical protein